LAPVLQAGVESLKKPDFAEKIRVFAKKLSFSVSGGYSSLPQPEM
jgi:hypothetical protein